MEESVRTYQLFLGQLISYWSDKILEALLWASWYHWRWVFFLRLTYLSGCFYMLSTQDAEMESEQNYP